MGLFSAALSFICLAATCSFRALSMASPNSVQLFPIPFRMVLIFGKVVDYLQFSNRLMCVRDVAQRSAILNWLMCNSARHRIITSRNANRIIAESSIDIKWYQKVTQNPATN